MGEALLRVQLLSVEQAAAALGYTVKHMRNIIRMGKIESYKLPRATKISTDALQDYLEQYRCPSKTQKSLSLKSTEGNGQLSGGITASGSVPRQAMRMRRALADAS